MSHITLKSGYTELVDRLNRFPQGAPPSETLYKILSMLFSEREAAIVALLPIRPFTAPKAARILKMDLTETRKVLDELASRAILLDTEHEGETTYILPPPMAGFFEFSMMRLRGDVDQKVLGELFYQYLNVEEDFIKALFATGETQLGRTFVHEPVLSSENALHVLDYERASEVIKTATHRGIGVCYCRHKMMHMGRNCDAPMEICMTFNGCAESLTRNGYARLVDVSEGLDLLQQAYEHNLVQFGENVREGVNFICNCCGCCCEAMIAARRFGMLNPVHTTNFLPVVDETTCNGCGKCANICPVEAMTLVSANDPNRASQLLTEAWRSVRDMGDPEASYAILTTARGVGRIKWLGPAFSTKFLYFAQGVAATPTHLILDKVVSTKLQATAWPDAPTAGWRPSTYGAYCSLMQHWTAEASDRSGRDVSPDEIEFTVFMG